MALAIWFVGFLALGGPFSSETLARDVAAQDASLEAARAAVEQRLKQSTFKDLRVTSNRSTQARVIEISARQQIDAMGDAQTLFAMTWQALFPDRFAHVDRIKLSLVGSARLRLDCPSAAVKDSFGFMEKSDIERHCRPRL